MAKEIIWAPKALEDYRKVFDYLTYKYDTTVANDFTDKIVLLLGKLASGNLIFKQSETIKGVNEVLITKQNLLLYRVKNNEIELLTIFDTRQHPNKKKL